MSIKFKALVIALAATSALPLLPADAQSMKVKPRDKANWYKAPPELQILDERPIVHDFREAPSAPASIQLPPPPQGFGGGSGGGSGALGGDDPGGAGGGPTQIPGGSGPGYRNFNPGTSLPLPHADFNHAQTNIPAGGIHPGGALPAGFTSGIHGKVMPWNPQQPMMASPAMSHPYQGRPVAAPHAASYSAPGGGYGPSVGNSAGGNGANSSVHGTLLNMLKKQK